MQVSAGGPLFGAALFVCCRKLDVRQGDSFIKERMWTMQQDPVTVRILDEVNRSTREEAKAYLLGALHDGTFNRLHRTLRIAQADVRWLHVLQVLLQTLGHRSWIYQEGTRNVWVIESTCHLKDDAFLTKLETGAFVRGYFDAEGGVPRASDARFYVQFVQKNQEDLMKLRSALTMIGVRCGVLHNPSVRVDPDYWRFYVRAQSHAEFVRSIGSWHPRKRLLLGTRFPGV
jgi:hypothetical protein